MSETTTMNPVYSNQVCLSVDLFPFFSVLPHWNLELDNSSAYQGLLPAPCLKTQNICKVLHCLPCLISHNCKVKLREQLQCKFNVTTYVFVLGMSSSLSPSSFSFNPMWNSCVLQMRKWQNCCLPPQPTLSDQDLGPSVQSFTDAVSATGTLTPPSHPASLRESPIALTAPWDGVTLLLNSAEKWL